MTVWCSAHNTDKSDILCHPPAADLLQTADNCKGLHSSCSWMQLAAVGCSLSAVGCTFLQLPAYSGLVHQRDVLQDTKGLGQTVAKQCSITLIRRRHLTPYNGQQREDGCLMQQYVS